MLKKWFSLTASIIIIIILSGCRTNSTPAESKSGWTLFSSGNQINMLITKGDELWAATAGGVEMWNQKTGDCRLYTIQDGLPENDIWGITQDNSGIVWAVTNFNVCFFNDNGWTTSKEETEFISGIISNHPGNDWVFSAVPLIRLHSRYPELFSPTDTLPANISFSSILTDQKGNMWANLMGTGIAYYNGQSWQVFPASDNSENRIYAMFVDAQNNLWCSTLKGISRYDGTNWQYFSNYNDSFESFIMTISQDKQGNLWFAHNDSTSHTLYRFDGSKLKKIPTDGLTNPTYITVDLYGIPWCTNAGGLSLYDGKSWQTFSGTDGFSEFLTSIIPDQNGDLWFGTGSSIKHYDDKVWQTLYTPQGPNDNQINSVFMDKAGNLWFGTNGGISYFNGKTWRTFTQSDGINAVTSPIFQDTQGNIWWATPTGIDRYDGKSVRKFDANDGIDMDYFFYVSSIVQDNKGNIWFGTQYSKPMATLIPGETYDPDINKQPEGGIYRYDGKSWQKFTTKDGLFSTSVQQMIKDNQGNIWFVDYQGITRYDGVNWKIFTQTDGITGTSIESIYNDKAGNIWVVTDSGLNRYNGKSWQSFELPAMNNMGKQLNDDGKNLLCFGGNSIYRFDGQAWQPFAIADGVSMLNTIIVNKNGDLWFGTQDGLAKYDSNKWQTFTILDNLQFNNIQSILIDRNGDIWCATAYGLARYNPNHK